MPKKILFESAVHQLAASGSRRIRAQEEAGRDSMRLRSFLRGLNLEHTGPRTIRASWTAPLSGSLDIDFSGARFYLRGDSVAAASAQPPRTPAADDPTELHNRRFFDERLDEIIGASGLDESPAGERARRLQTEEAFHDDWADSVDVTKMDVQRLCGACTAPEMRFIRERLGDLRGTKLLDVGCGLGEAGVYFATLGADVTVTDLSAGMLRAATRLARHSGVSVTTHHGPAESLALAKDVRFDVIYIGNTLHHVDISETLDRLLPLLKPTGTFVSWDPVHYNPLIRVYRRMAMDVRTPDEHPFKAADIRLLSSRFERTEQRFFWLTTLLIFIYMYVVQRRHPGKERYWKRVVDEADRWESMYRPLEKLDRLLLRAIPPLGYLCWNVVLIGRGVRR